MYHFHIVFVISKQWRYFIPMTIVLMNIFPSTQTANDKRTQSSVISKMNCSDTETGMRVAGVQQLFTSKVRHDHDSFKF